MGKYCNNHFIPKLILKNFKIPNSKNSINYLIKNNKLIELRNITKMNKYYNIKHFYSKKCISEIKIAILNKKGYYKYLKDLIVFSKDPKLKIIEKTEFESIKKFNTNRNKFIHNMFHETIKNTPPSVFNNKNPMEELEKNYSSFPPQLVQNFVLIG